MSSEGDGRGRARVWGRVGVGVGVVEPEGRAGGSVLDAARADVCGGEGRA